MDRAGTEELVPRVDIQELDRLKAELQASLLGRIHDLRLVPRDQGVVLEGRAVSYYAKQLAQHEVIKVAHLPIHANDIRVLSEGPHGAAPRASRHT
jgi:hypothetical protein